MLAKNLNAAAFSLPYSGWLAQVRNGDCSRRNTATGMLSTADSRAGLSKASSSDCINPLPMMQIWSTCSLIRPLFALIRVRQGPQKSGGQAAQALGRSRGGFSTKIHIAVDALGNPLCLLLTAGQRHDSPQAAALIDGFEPQVLIADKGYDSDPLLESLKALGIKPVIPPKKNRLVQREYDRYLYRERHLIECFINKIKHYRRVFSRFDKLSKNYLGFLSFVSALVWLR